MSISEGRTRNFKRRISIERAALGDANSFSEALEVEKLLGLSDAAIRRWTDGLREVTSALSLQQIDTALRDLARATGLLSDDSRCAIAEGKVSSDFPTLLEAFKIALRNAPKYPGSMA